MSRRGALAGAGCAVVLLAVAGCGGTDPREWDDTDAVRLAALTDDGWLRARGSAPDVLDGYDRWQRPRVSAERRASGQPWEVVAAEVRRADREGWQVAFVRCAGPLDDLLVDLTRVLPDRSTATARVTATLGYADEPGRGVGITVVAVAAHHLDLDAAVDPAGVTSAEPVDPDVCLAAPGAPMQVRWSGSPAVMIARGGPAPADG